MRKKRTIFAFLIASLSLLAAACGSNSVTSSTGESTTSAPAGTEEGASESVAEVDLSVRISEQDLEQARATLDGARAHWDDREPVAFTMAVGFDSINQIEIDFDADGNVIEERVVFGDANDTSWGTFPRSVPEAFDIVDEQVTLFETGEREVPPSGDCGNHFNASFDESLGSVTYFDTLGPCDDGVGLRIDVWATGEGREGDGPVEPQGDCDQAALMGEWLSPRAAGTEPLAEDDGVNDEGGVGVVVLNLRDNGAGLQSGDTIEEFGEWFCTASTVLGITENGEEVTLATINDDGALTAGNWMLTKTDG